MTTSYRVKAKLQEFIINLVLNVYLPVFAAVRKLDDQFLIEFSGIWTFPPLQ